MLHEGATYAYKRGSTAEYVLHSGRLGAIASTDLILLHGMRFGCQSYTSTMRSRCKSIDFENRQEHACPHRMAGPASAS